VTEGRFGFSQYVGLAKGLAKIAKFQEILLSEEIEKQVIEKFTLSSLGMLSIEGMSSQILVCRVDNVVGELVFPKQKKEEPILSRKKEIESLKNLLTVANAVLVVGHHGCGKTVFLDQVTDEWSEKEIYRTFCPSYSIGRTLKPITDIVTQILGVYDVDSIEQKQTLIEKKLKSLEIMDIGTSYLAILDFLGLNEEESILEKLEVKTRVEIISQSVAETVKRISWNSPVMIIIEDVENMDASSANFVEQLMTQLAEENVQFIFTAAMSEIDISGLKEFELRGIEKKRLENLVENITDEKITLPPTTPFHVLQYLRLYQEEKIIYLYNQYRGESALANFSLAFHDIETTVKRRLDLLDNDKIEFILSLAVAGVEISPDELPVDKKNLFLFDYFVNKIYLQRHYNNYIFTSPLLHNEIYNLIEDKQNRHARLADYYRRIHGFEEQAAFHYLKADNYKKAIEFLMKSANLAIRKGGYESAINYYIQALDLCHRKKDSVDLEILVALNEGLADVYRSLGDEEKALKYYKVVLDSYKEILKE
jgi:tetratricopeptide (TPR) repeat protein/ABC-type lipoprotein export system ATPase subunit